MVLLVRVLVSGLRVVVAVIDMAFRPLKLWGIIVHWLLSQCNMALVDAIYEFAALYANLQTRLTSTVPWSNVQRMYNSRTDAGFRTFMALIEPLMFEWMNNFDVEDIIDIVDDIFDFLDAMTSAIVNLPVTVIKLSLFPVVATAEALVTKSSGRVYNSMCGPDQPLRVLAE
ncbi:Uncharacterized protein PBTT_00858 [Plasmodiophora brassicae]